MKTDERIAIDQKALGVLQNAFFAERSNAYCAWVLHIKNNEVWRARHDGYVSPALIRAMVGGGYLDPHEVAAVLTVEVPPCPECGEAHTQKTCAYNRKSPDRGRTFAARLPDDLFDEIVGEARRQGLTNGEFLANVFEGWHVAMDEEIPPLVTLADAASALNEIGPPYYDVRLAEAATEER